MKQLKELRDLINGLEEHVGGNMMKLKAVFNHPYFIAGLYCFAQTIALIRKEVGQKLGINLREYGLENA